MLPDTRTPNAKAWRLPRLAATALAALLATGCSFIPTYERPAAPVAGTFPGGAASAGQTAAAAADIAWQDYFPDPRLKQLIGMALASNRDLRVAMLNVEQARATYQIRRADQYPNLGLGVNASRGPNAANGNLTNSFSVGLAVTAWELDFFGRIASLKEAALAQYLATDEGRKAAQISIVSAVANTWLNVLADEELLAITRQALGTREESLKLTNLRFDSGVSSELDFQQATSLAESARATLAQAQRQRALDENALVLLLGQPVPEGVLAGGAARLSDAINLPEVPAGLPSDLLIKRPDIRQAEEQLIAANANIGAARAAFFPRIALTAQAGTASNQLSGLFNSGSWGFTIAPSLLLPIFDAGRNQAGLESSNAARAIAVAQYEKSIQTAFREVADGLAGREALTEQLRAQRAQTAAEAQRFKLSDLRYRNGIASYLDMLDAQRSLFTAQQAVVQVRLLQLQNQVQLYKALGGGWTDPAVATAAQQPAQPAVR
ncbi:MAG: efflux transporter outer membrane subunit [Comamonadaceae bacterium]|nr:MAG: efflux transporter outer membrane subunit [Comamonadaceae bacterium]